MLLILLPPPPHLAVRHPDNLGRLPPLQLAGHRFWNHFLYFHNPLHFCSQELLFDGFHITQLSPPAVEADISLAN
jgi:hypothetical protein